MASCVNSEVLKSDLNCWQFNSHSKTNQEKVTTHDTVETQTTGLGMDTDVPCSSFLLLYESAAKYGYSVSVFPECPMLIILTSIWKCSKTWWAVFIPKMHHKHDETLNWIMSHSHRCSNIQLYSKVQHKHEWEC
jgi:hypothetical protein